MSRVMITSEQLEALLQYYELHGVDAMWFELEHLAETLEEFGPSPQPLRKPKTKPDGTLN